MDSNRLLLGVHIRYNGLFRRNHKLVQLTAYHENSVFETLKPEWNELLHRSASDCIFSTWEWQSTWWDAYHSGLLWVIACRDDSGRLIGIAPWFIQTNEEQERV